MLKRKAYHKLLSWKETPSKSALCIIGARQIGKTTLIREFARNEYNYFIEINFVTDPKAGKIFSRTLTANEIIINLTAYVQQKMVPGETLVFLDEIQECPEARAAIKFLVEDGRFDYIESGSLLGVRYNEVPSYPVGFEEIFYMYPMDFEEFAQAVGVQEDTFQYLEKCFHDVSPVSGPVHDVMCKLFYAYLVVGGMPENVQIYVDTNDINQVINNQKAILELYRQDIGKYAYHNEKEKIRAIFDAIPAQLNDNNRRFILSSLSKTARMNRYEDSINWLIDAGVALASYNIAEPQSPLQLNEKRNLFKLFLNDTGLLCSACMDQIQFDLLLGHVDINMGSILENVFAQQLKANGYALHYFDSKKYGELDFVIQNGTSIDLLEIKSGNDYKKHPAINHVSKVENWSFRKKIVFCKGNVEYMDEILYLPWYMIIFYKQVQDSKPFIHTIDLSGLKL